MKPCIICLLPHEPWKWGEEKKKKPKSTQLSPTGGLSLGTGQKTPAASCIRQSFHSISDAISQMPEIDVHACIYMQLLAPHQTYFSTFSFWEPLKKHYKILRVTYVPLLRSLTTQLIFFFSMKVLKLILSYNSQIKLVLTPVKTLPIQPLSLTLGNSV